MFYQVMALHFLEDLILALRRNQEYLRIDLDSLELK
jgi:hypothetical protein